MGISLLYLGELYDLEHAIAMIAALVVTTVLPQFYRPASRPTVRERRLIALWMVLALGAMEVIELAVPCDGPLGQHYPVFAFWDVAVDVIIIALVANGLRRGYRVAWLATIVLGAVNIVSAIAALFTVNQLIDAGFVPDAQSIVPQYVAPAVFWSIVLVYLAVGRSAFRVAIRRSRRGVRAGAVTRDELIDSIRAHGGGTISWMTTWPENKRIAIDDGVAVYQDHVGVGIMVGDPIVADGAYSAAMESYASRMQDAGLIPCMFSASDVVEREKPAGWRSLVVAEDTIVDLPGLEFKGKPWNHVRTAINRAGRENIEFRMVRLAEQPWSIIAQVRAISEQWSGDKGLPEMRFTLGTVEEALDPEVFVGIAVDEQGSLHGVTSWLPVYDRRQPGRIAGWTLDLMRRRADGFGPVMEFLIALSARYFSDHGYDFISLSGAPLVRADDSEPGVIDQLLGRLSEMFEPLYGFRSLHRFKQKFNPRYESLHLIYRDEGDLPRIGAALTRAYLPDARLRDLVFQSASSARSAARRSSPAVPSDHGQSAASAPIALDTVLERPVPLAGSVRARVGAALSVVGESLGLIIQLLLVYVGLMLAQWMGSDTDTYLVLLWCVLATLYLGSTIIGLNVLVWLNIPEPPLTRRLIGHPLSRILSTALTFCGSFLGLREAMVLIVDVSRESFDPLIESAAVWTMLLSWALFNWGFARIYYSRYHRAAEPPLVFPNTENPRLPDFVYFAFTNATTFATSDVQIVTTRMRWTVVWHTTMAFFFNALIIVLTMNVIADGRLFESILSL